MPLLIQVDKIFWTVREPEILDFNQTHTNDRNKPNRIQIQTTPNLCITPYKSINQYGVIPWFPPSPYPQIPAMTSFNAGHLFRLEISYMDVTDMPRIPNSVSELSLIGTTVTNLNQINVDWTQITRLVLCGNPGLDGTSLNVPEGIEELVITEQQFRVVRNPSTLLEIRATSIYLEQLTGYLPKYLFKFDLSSTIPLYRTALKQFDYKCDDELENSWGSFDRIKHKWHLRKMEYIQSVNNDRYTQVYSEFGSIPGRIRNAYDHRHNPIVAAMHLASNYPRRMAEFVTEVTMIG